jgi:hypothetical protein
MDRERTRIERCEGAARDERLVEGRSEGRLPASMVREEA